VSIVRSPHHYVKSLSQPTAFRTDAASARDRGRCLIVATVDNRSVLRKLEGDECPWTEDCSGELEREEYKDTDALVCPDCDTPIVRVW